MSWWYELWMTRTMLCAESETLFVFQDRRYAKRAIMDIKYRYGLERTPWWLIGATNGDRIERHDRLLEAGK